jgi:hypothetical protein
MRYREILFEMSTLYPRVTGLPFVIWVSQKVAVPPWNKNPEAIYTIEPFAFVEGDDWLNAQQKTDLEEWVNLNRKLLMDFWNEIIQDEDVLKQQIINIGDAPPNNNQRAIGALQGCAPKVQAIYWQNKTYILIFDQYIPDVNKISRRFSSLGFNEPIKLENSVPANAILLWEK